MKKRLLIVLTCILFMCAFAFLLCACKKDNTATHDNQGLYYTLNKEETGYIASYSSYSGVKEVFIPLEHEGIPVVALDRNAFAYSDVESVEIPITITSIGEGAFYRCESLKKVNIPISVKSIGKNLFRDCTSLKSITLHDNITSIEDGAFWGCSSLESITIPDSVTSIGHSAFSDCTGLKTVNMKQNLKRIGPYAFFACTSLTNLYLPNDVTSIGEFAFHDCTSLTYNVQSGLKYLASNFGNPYFYLIGPENKNITIAPINLLCEFIGSMAFYECNNLKTVTMFNIKQIGHSAFSNCTNLTNVTISKLVTTIDKHAFFLCKNLKEIIIPDNVITLGESVFASSGVTTIYCKANSQPSGWDSEWKTGCSANVVWGYTEK